MGIGTRKRLAVAARQLPRDHPTGVPRLAGVPVGGCPANADMPVMTRKCLGRRHVRRPRHLDSMLQLVTGGDAGVDVRRSYLVGVLDT
jgi:hypothetical protein